MSDFGQRVGLVHELRQRICAEESIYHRRYGLRVDKVYRFENLIVTHIHALADGARHTGKAHAELVVELLAYSAHATVAQVVDIIHIALRVYKLYKILDNGDNIFAREHLYIVGGVKPEFLVDSETAHLAEVISFLREEKVLDNLARRRIVRWLRVAKLPVDILDGLLFRIR